MSHTLETLAKWPKHKTGRPLFTNAGEALYYAQLIWRNEDEQKLLNFFRDNCYAKLKFQRESKVPDYQRMMDLAIEAQFYRECLQECQRINDERLTL